MGRFPVQSHGLPHQGRGEVHGPAAVGQVRAGVVVSRLVAAGQPGVTAPGLAGLARVVGGSGFPVIGVDFGLVGAARLTAVAQDRGDHVPVGRPLSHLEAHPVAALDRRVIEAGLV
ncbi:MAG: hypothetical protein C4551_08385 [Bacillota bacterium]|nr:MAG: hypothetical protein C4551_08385 [Bacillota bacterium]